MTQQMVITSYYTLEGRSFVANLNIGGLMTLGEQQLGSMRGAILPSRGVSLVVASRRVVWHIRWSRPLPI